MESYRGSRSVSRIPSSPPVSSEDELFHQVFDWNSYYQDTQDTGTFPSASAVIQSNWGLSDDYYQLSKGFDGAESYPIDGHSLESLESDFWRMNANLRASDDEEAPSPPSDYTGGHSPPGLVPAGSTSPSEHSGSSSSVLDAADHDHYARLALSEAKSYDDEWTYPQGEPSPKQLPVGYPSHIQLHDAKSPEAAGLKRRRSSNAVEKRHRQLQDPMQTADVRKTGACVPCRVSKIRCHENGVCPTCRKAFPEHSHLVCTRVTPGMTWPVIGRIPDIWSEDAAEEDMMCNGPRFHTGNPKKILLYLSKDSSSNPLKVTVQAYRMQEDSNETGGLRLADFPRDEVPSHGQLQGWVEEEIKREHTTKFRYALQSFMLAYHQDGEGLPRHRLVSNVHRLNCFFRIWKTDAFWCRDPTNKFVSLPLSVQARLRNIARQGARFIEHDILRELDEILAQQGAIKSEERLAVWASLWQLILIYRETLATFKKHMGRLAKEYDAFDPIAAEHGKLYRWMLDLVFPLMTTFYHYQFRTKKSLEVSLDWLSSSKYPSKACKSKTLHLTSKHLFESRKDFYSRVQGSSNEIDKLLASLVVNHELKKLNARRRNPKSSKSKGSRHDDECDDDDDE
ncbi:hypothetical protein A9K55_005275 [Cordyceps militaris]|uniref:Uncharacterized protein n=1 Tax=Cordyceps militaris TaxID=73501 RepID=A0A2H4SP73_CORMI|nr:hypothetical protein A9K55_005275 [Cordyceps militaris]